MKTHIFISAVALLLVSSSAFAQMGGYGAMGNANTQRPSNSGSEKTTTTTTSKKVMPVGVKGYLDEQLANSKDKKFHVTLNGKDLALTPVKIPAETKGAGKARVPVDMKAADGKIYEIDFVVTNNQVTGASIGKVNGKSPSTQ